MRSNNTLAQQLVHDLSFDTELGTKIKDYDKKVEIVEKLLNKITSPKNVVDLYSKLDVDIYSWCQDMIKLVPTTYTDELGRKVNIRYDNFCYSEYNTSDDSITIKTSRVFFGEDDDITLHLPFSLFVQGDKQKAADYLYNVTKGRIDSECEREKQRRYNEDLAEYNRLKEKLGL